MHLVTNDNYIKDIEKLLILSLGEDKSIFYYIFFTFIEKIKNNKK